MILKNKLKTNKGFSLVEILIGTAIICTTLLLVVNLEAGVSRIGFSSVTRVQAGMLAEEGVTAVQNIRNRSWNLSVLNNNTPYYIVWNDTIKGWEISSSPSLIDQKFTRTITFYEVKRNGSTFDIVDSSNPSGVIDAGTKKFIVNVVWDSGFGTSTKSINSYVYNI